MSEIVAAAGIAALGCTGVLIIVAMRNLVRQGPSEIRRLRRGGYGLKAFGTGQMPKAEPGATIDVMEGLEFISRGGKIASVRPTRTVSGEIA